MGYVTQQEVIDAYGLEAIQALTDRAEPPRRRIDTGLLQQAIDAAGEIADGHLAQRYTLPLDRIPAELRAQVLSLTFFNLHRNRREEIEDGVRQGRDDAMAFLEKVAKGAVLLTTQTAGSAAAQESGSAGTPLFVAGARTFDTVALRGYW
ncbi:MAG: DUF1320 domain-containing protein [Magnetococcales bacterium]|nr:DUF1320 domain-containing protein [Magnetococcales bacterium]